MDQYKVSKKKYQVFVSSTFTDLKNERQSASKAILNLGHIPAGMELFPAADVDQLNFIKRVIDDCDYYILIIGGRYGSTTPEGLSYTELEYNYAVETKKPVLAFIHENTLEIKSGNVESDPEKLKRLEMFKSTVRSGRLVEFWRELEGLEAKVLIALTAAFNDTPQVGWRRDSGELSEIAANRLEQMRERHDKLRERNEALQARAYAAERKLEGYESLGAAEIEVRFKSDGEHISRMIGAENIIREFASDLMDGLTLSQIDAGLKDLIRHKYESDVEEISITSSRNVQLFLEVFEIAQKAEDNQIRIRSDKKWLLKAAFYPLKKVIEDEEIPF